ncbi:MAG: hypothetical protein JWM95_2325 [Gemmatimonadetes bacterium]|nr:hypothetical protein [Gemmatimonadota bacterium]
MECASDPYQLMRLHNSASLLDFRHRLIGGDAGEVGELRLGEVQLCTTSADRLPIAAAGLSGTAGFVSCHLTPARVETHRSHS